MIDMSKDIAASPFLSYDGKSPRLFGKCRSINKPSLGEGRLTYFST